MFDLVLAALDCIEQFETGQVKIKQPVEVGEPHPAAQSERDEFGMHSRSGYWGNQARDVERLCFSDSK